MTRLCDATQCKCIRIQLRLMMLTIQKQMTIHGVEVTNSNFLTSLLLFLEVT